MRTLKGSGSYIADPSLDSLSAALEAYSVLTTDHGAILAAIRNGDSELAAESMRSHLLLSHRHYLDLG
jgi:DNA-binding FadR family transcriptional regulator